MKLSSDMLTLLIAAALMAGCTSSGQKSELDSLSREYVRLERMISQEKKAGRTKELAEAKAEYVRVSEALNKYPELEIYEALKRVPGSPYGQ